MQIKRIGFVLCILVLFGIFVTINSAGKAVAQTVSDRENFVVTPPAFPLKLSSDPNARYLVDQNNQPFFIVGEAAWSLIGQVSLEDAQLYLDDLAARGFNTVIVTLVEGYYADNAPANFYNVQPYIPANNFSSPNEVYFAHADAVLNYAASKGILVILAPNYLGCCSDGWRNVLERQNTIQDAINYGTFVGNRYRDYPNLLYTWGDDMNPDNTNVRDKIAAMANAVKAADPNHLHTFHGGPEYSSLDIKNIFGYNWLDLNSVYTYLPVQGEMINNYDPDGNLNTAPPMPLFLFESHYETDWDNRDALTTRREGYVAVLTGASGYAYGNNPIWHMNGHPFWNPTDWHLHLTDEGRTDMTHFMALFNSRDWVSLVPDLNDTLVTANKGSGEDYSAAAITADGNTAIIYFPSAKTLQVSLDKINGAQARVWWFNPQDGSAQDAGTLPTAGIQAFTPPSNQDWLLVLDNADLNLPAPGSSLQLTATPSATATNGPSATPTPTMTPSPTATATSLASATPTNTPPPSNTPTPTKTPKKTATPTSLPATSTPTSQPASPTPTVILTATATATPKRSTPTPTPTGGIPTATPLPTATARPPR
ncbi:MAG TPA: DUF4038 domain-containing protein [Anaerolineales bacterium]|nr:DUF4038 domain-containing protein [Anaerolineales bacterium]